MSEHVVTFEARAHTSATANNTKAALVARCACGWTHVFVPNAGREHAILVYGLEHVTPDARPAIWQLADGLQMDRRSGLPNTEPSREGFWTTYVPEGWPGRLTDPQPSVSGGTDANGRAAAGYPRRQPPGQQPSTQHGRREVSARQRRPHHEPFARGSGTAAPTRPTSRPTTARPGRSAPAAQLRPIEVADSDERRERRAGCDIAQKANDRPA